MFLKLARKKCKSETFLSARTNNNKIIFALLINYNIFSLLTVSNLKNLFQNKNQVNNDNNKIIIDLRF